MNIPRPISRQPLPDTAQKVFSGKVFDVYQWEVDGYDGSKKVFEKVKRADTVLVLGVTEDKQIITTLQEQPGKQPFTGIAGGRVDEGEDVLVAAKRELLEETGYEATEWILFDAQQPISKVEWAVYIFIAKGCHKVKEQDLDGAEKIEVSTMSFDDFVDFITQKNGSELELKLAFLEARLDSSLMETYKKMILE